MPRNPHAAALVRRKHKYGDVPDLLRVVWAALVEAQAVLERATEDEVKLKAVHAIVQAGGTYGKLLEIGALEDRLAALEAQMRGQAA